MTTRLENTLSALATMATTPTDPEDSRCMCGCCDWRVTTGVYEPSTCVQCDTVAGSYVSELAEGLILAYGLDRVEEAARAIAADECDPWTAAGALFGDERANYDDPWGVEYVREEAGARGVDPIVVIDLINEAVAQKTTIDMIAADLIKVAAVLFPPEEDDEDPCEGCINPLSLSCDGCEVCESQAIKVFAPR